MFSTMLLARVVGVVPPYPRITVRLFDAIDATNSTSSVLAGRIRSPTRNLLPLSTVITVAVVGVGEKLT